MNEPGKPNPSASATNIHIFVSAHTNVGKTALLRTLLGRDVGVVEDAPDITTITTSHELVVGSDGGALLIWDSPGFGDSFRLAKRFRLRHRWLAWMVREMWDRYRNPSLWRSQRLALDLRARADVVLYPVSLLERPIDAVYVAPELEVLGWAGKPVLVILNQGGALLNNGDAAIRVAEWRTALATHPVVQSVIDLDAFTRCWLQELMLFEEIGRLLPNASRPRYQQLADGLALAYVDRFDASVAAIADYLMQVAADGVDLDTRWFSGVTDAVELIRDKLPWGKSNERRPAELAMEALAQRFAECTKDLANQLVAVNRLDGVSSAEVLQVATEQLCVNGPLSKSTSSLVGGVVSGVLTGLTADLMAGGLTLGTGALVGGVLGALGGAAIAEGYNVLRSKGKKVIRWSPRSVVEALDNSVLLYLSVAHFGRGQGTWRKKAVPTQWSAVVDQVLKGYQDRLDQMWGARDLQANVSRVRAEHTLLVGNVLRDVLICLYPKESGALSAKKPVWEQK
ncbi:MAG: hypothetical protein DI603_14545 [Roseateles depolymerans]|uniref:G domain-containing protein n=1 Tax=Roseateles depolymerans TaxID=76731 RepID=A0A2W5FDC3_9BURK|nr:MAG: hypothetical protein DI603_14545 [Roseateles depolymerans]